MQPLEIATPHVIYDISRLCRSWNHPFATGVDRIDLAIGLNLLKTHRNRCHFLHRGAFGPIILPYSFGRRILLHLDRIWNRSKSGLLSQYASLELSIYSLRPIRSLRFRAGESTYVVASHSGVGKAPGGLQRLDPQMNMERWVYIHDLIPLEMPEYQRPGTDQSFLSYLTELMNGNVTIISNSLDTERRFVYLAKRQKWKISKFILGTPTLKLIKSTINTTNPEVSAYLADTRPFFIIIGTIEPRKNHLLLLHLWRQICLTSSSPPRLCIIGKRGWENENIVDILERCHVIKGVVAEFGSLSDNDVQRLLRASKALLFPSFIEGLGVPLLEAAALNVQCVVADLPVFREIAPAGTIFLDPLDGLGWKAVILKLAFSK